MAANAREIPFTLRGVGSLFGPPAQQALPDHIEEADLNDAVHEYQRRRTKLHAAGHTTFKVVDRQAGKETGLPWDNIAAIRADVDASQHSANISRNKQNTGKRSQKGSS